MCSAVGRQAYFSKTRATCDMLSLDAVYHRACLTKIYREIETADDTERNETQLIKAHVLNELIGHIEEYHDSGNHHLWLTWLCWTHCCLGFFSIRCNTTVHVSVNILKYCFLMSNRYEQIVVGPLYLMMTSAKLFSARKEIEPPTFPSSSRQLKYFVTDIFIFSKNLQVPFLQHLSLMLSCQSWSQFYTCFFMDQALINHHLGLTNQK